MRQGQRVWLNSTTLPCFNQVPAAAGTRLKHPKEDTQAQRRLPPVYQMASRGEFPNRNKGHLQ
jgi:hypothetical protein